MKPIIVASYLAVIQRSPKGRREYAYIGRVQPDGSVSIVAECPNEAFCRELVGKLNGVSLRMSESELKPGQREFPPKVRAA